MMLAMFPQMAPLFSECSKLFRKHQSTEIAALLDIARSSSVLAIASFVLKWYMPEKAMARYPRAPSTAYVRVDVGEINNKISKNENKEYKVDKAFSCHHLVVVLSLSYMLT